MADEADLVGGLAERLAIARGEHHVAAGGGQLERNATPDARSRTWRAVFSLDPAKPLITSIGTGATRLVERAQPFYRVATGIRRGGWDAAGVPSVEHFVKLGSWFAGTPQQLVELLKDFEQRYPGMEHISLSSPIGTPRATMIEQFQWVAEEVMPAFRA